MQIHIANLKGPQGIQGPVGPVSTVPGPRGPAGGTIDADVLVDTTAGTKVTVGGHVVRYESGLRNIAGLVAHTTSTFDITVKRSNDLVQMAIHVRQFDVSGVTTGENIMTLPVGFRPATRQRTLAVTPSGVQLDFLTSGEVRVAAGTIPLGAYVTFVHNFSASATLPTSLPGTPA